MGSLGLPNPINPTSAVQNSQMVARIGTGFIAGTSNPSTSIAARGKALFGK